MNFFSGSDISGRDELFGAPRVAAPRRASAPPSGRMGSVARSVVAASTFVFGLSVCFSVDLVPFGLYSEHAVVDVEVDLVDPLERRILEATTDEDPPTDEAKNSAVSFHRLLGEVGVEADHVVADPDGGVALYVFSSSRRKFVRLLFTNDDETIVTFEDRDANKRQLRSLDRMRSPAEVTAVRSFLFS